MSPGEVNRLPALIGDPFVNPQRGLVTPETYRLHKMERRTNSADFEADLDLIRLVPGDCVSPRQKRHLAVLAEFGALMQ